MATLKGSVDLHSVTDISVDAIKELRTSNGTPFCMRRLTIGFADGSDLTLELYARDDEDRPEGDTRDSFRCLEVLL